MLLAGCSSSSVTGPEDSQPLSAASPGAPPPVAAAPPPPPAAAAAPPAPAPAAVRPVVAPPTPAVPAAGSAAARAAGPSPIDATVYIGAVELWDDDVPATAPALEEMYVQIEVSGVPAAEAANPAAPAVPRNYDDEKRNAIARFFWGKDWSATLNFKLRVAAPDLEATIPLVSFGHESNSKVGEVFVTELTRSAVRTPYFRVSPQSKLSVTTEYRNSKSVSSTVVRTALNIAREATQVVAPGASVLTTLSREGFRGQAQVFDTALNMMFAENTTERETSDFALRYWRPGIAIQASLDSPVDSKSPSYKIGVWQLKLSYPRPSTFSPVEVCGKTQAPFCQDTPANARQAVMTSVSPAAILGYRIVPNTTIATYLAQQSWYAEEAGTLTRAGASAAGFCNRIVRALYDLGLNEFDGRLSARAVGQLMPMDVAALNVIRAESNCKP
jgi:hypothetical protein